MVIWCVSISIFFYLPEEKLWEAIRRHSWVGLLCFLLDLFHGGNSFRTSDTNINIKCFLFACGAAACPLGMLDFIYTSHTHQTPQTAACHVQNRSNLIGLRWWGQDCHWLLLQGRPYDWLTWISTTPYPRLKHICIQAARSGHASVYERLFI